MILVDNIEEFECVDHSIVTSGTFDGVHVGHQKILRQLVETAKLHKGQSIVITLWPHPRFVLNRDPESLKLLSTFEEKAALIEEMGVDILLKIPFTKGFSELSSRSFIQDIIIKKLNTEVLIIGYDHRFGKNREGGFDYLMNNANEFGFEVKEIPREDIDHAGVSSTRIRNALAAGEVHIATELLGRHYSLSGFVKDGDRIGRSIGFPTANIDVPESYKLTPGDGAYAVYIHLGNEKFQGMLNIGLRPTVSGQERRIEVNIFNFDREIYNKRLTIEFVQLLRKEKKFDSIELLKDQLNQDKLQALDALSL
ncbi:MAG: bifunctional riboflavin kinase/FAD synthetase [Cyclobacteriaceae bacterium]|nr:bifunctional riboflavin kinase/FAD synthetase [Cyclobacteriaceae bacterium SS2]